MNLEMLFDGLADIHRRPYLICAVAQIATPKHMTLGL
jgi:hypothetical protein